MHRRLAFLRESLGVRFYRRECRGRIDIRPALSEVEWGLGIRHQVASPRHCRGMLLAFGKKRRISKNRYRPNGAKNGDAGGPGRHSLGVGGAKPEVRGKRKTPAHLPVQGKLLVFSLAIFFHVFRKLSKSDTVPKLGIGGRP